MNEVYLSKQKIFNEKNGIFAYELVFKDADNKTTKIATRLSRTSKIIMSSIRLNHHIHFREKKLMPFYSITIKKRGNTQLDTGEIFQKTH